MPDFPSNTSFAAYHQYAPQGRSAFSRRSKDVIIAVKNDGFESGRQIIPYAGERFAQDISKLGEYSVWFSTETMLIPVPKSTPILPGAVWPSFRICEELKTRGLGGNISTCLKRKFAVQKSATARGNRPSPIDHYKSVEIVIPERLLFTPERIVLVDDVVTRGSTFVGLMPRIQERFPTRKSSVLRW